MSAIRILFGAAVLGMGINSAVIAGGGSLWINGLLLCANSTLAVHWHRELARLERLPR